MHNQLNHFSDEELAWNLTETKGNVVLTSVRAEYQSQIQFQARYVPKLYFYWGKQNIKKKMVFRPRLKAWENLKQKFVCSHYKNWKEVNSQNSHQIERK